MAHDYGARGRGEVRRRDRGVASQVVKMLTLNCGTGPVPPAPVDYTIRLTYQR